MDQRGVRQRSCGADQYVHRGNARRGLDPQSNGFAANCLGDVHHLIQQATIPGEFSRARGRIHAELMQTSRIYQEIYDSQLGDGVKAAAQ